MRIRLSLQATLPIVALLAFTQQAVAQTPADAAGQVIDCAGGVATVTGDGGAVAVRGSCRALIVQGNGNQISAELAPRAQVHVQGDGNHVRYRLVGGTEDALVTVAGRDDVVGPDAASVAGTAAPATRAPLILGAGTPAGPADCTDRDVSIEGADGTYTLQGGCRSLTVNGNGDTVHAEMQPQSRIAVPGQMSRVFWFLSRGDQPPVIEGTGANSQVLQEQRLGSRIAPPSAAPVDSGDQPPLVLTGSQGGMQDCHGRAAQITADHTDFVLRDRCRSLSVTGNGVTVEAEILSGSRIQINGAGTTVQFALSDTGPDPIVSIQGDGSRAWRIQRLGAASRATASVGVVPTERGMKVEGGHGAAVNEMPSVTQESQPQ
jgi:hypothetical protein